MTARWFNGHEKAAAETTLGPGEELPTGDAGQWPDGPPLRLADQETAAEENEVAGRETAVEENEASDREQAADQAVKADPASIGKYVTSVLAAAEAAAANLQREAEAEAGVVRRRAAADAEAMRAKAVADAEAATSEKLRQATAAEEQARALRDEAEQYAEQRHVQADADAERIVQDARRQAEEIEQLAAARHHTLLTDIASSEQRMGGLAASLHAVASRLEEVAADRIPLAEQAAHGWPQPDSAAD